MFPLIHGLRVHAKKRGKICLRQAQFGTQTADGTGGDAGLLDVFVCDCRGFFAVLVCLCQQAPVIAFQFGEAAFVVGGHAFEHGVVFAQAGNGGFDFFARQSLDFFFGLPLDSMAIVNLVPFPGTEVRELCEREGYLTEEARNWDNYFFSLNNPIPLVETPYLSREELVSATRKAYRRMYLQPQWLWRSLRHLSPRQIVLGTSIMLGLRGRKKREDIAWLGHVPSDSKGGDM